MADLFTNISGTTQFNDELVELYKGEFIQGVGNDNVMEPYVIEETIVGAKTIHVTKIPRLDETVSALLVEREEVTPSSMADSDVAFTPVEHGIAVVETSLAQLQSGGKAARASVWGVGKHYGSYTDIKAIEALDASTNILTPSDIAVASLAASNVLDITLLKRMFNKLQRAGVPKIDGAYLSFIHADNLYDVKNTAAVGTWTDVNKYATPETILMGEVGMLEGFRFITQNHATITADAGAGNVDVYRSYFCGMGALGKAVSQPLTMVMKAAPDLLDRFMVLGWKSTFQYKILDTDCVWTAKTASSIGANA